MKLTEGHPPLPGLVLKPTDGPRGAGRTDADLEAADIKETPDPVALDSDVNLVSA